MEKEEIKLSFDDIPALAGETADIRERKRAKLMPVLVTVAAAILVTVSLAVHTVIFTSVYNACKNGKTDVLVSMILPNIKEIGARNDISAKSREAVREDKNEEKEKITVDTPGPIINCDLSTNVENAMALMNETGYEPDLRKLIGREKPISPAEKIYEEYGEGAPLVLIYHTHGTEAYSECAGKGFRSEDITENVVAVGAAMSEALDGYGIGNIHLCEMFDKDDFNTAYDRSTAAVRDVLSEYPSVKYIIDVHRDFVDRNGEYVKCSAVSGENSFAQLMLVCGTDEGGSGHENWRDNLTFALQLQSLLWQKSPGLMRPIDLKSASFYQDTGAGSLIVEFGSCGNSLEEAKASARLFARTLCEYAER